MVSHPIFWFSGHVHNVFPFRKRSYFHQWPATSRRKKSQNKENAIKLVKFLSSEEAIEKLSRSGLITPARKIKDNENIFTKMLNHAKPTPTNTSYNKINDILRTKGESVLLGEKTAEEAFDENTIKKLESLL